MTMAAIKPIDAGSVHRIHSGQVVLDLQSCLKELVENSLDAGATSIEVRIKDHGLTSIEILDNGTGIAQADWASIGLKHHTSKLPELAVLHTVTSFGFRGEALSALCALCESVTVTTSTKEMEPMGAVIQLGRDGRVLDDKARVARPRGTTITLTNLFAPLPVRRKEFERNAKRELGKALTLLTAYALIPSIPTPDRPGVRIKVETLASGIKGIKRNTVLSNDARADLRSSTMAVWGTKALEGVLGVDIEIKVEMDKLAKRDRASMASADGEDEIDQVVRVKGLISSAAWGQGRSASDRQYLYVNGRPADLKSIQRTINEVYKTFNTHQVPIAILDFQIPREAVDINVSPDKRTIFLHSETNFLAALRSGLETFWAPSRSTFAIEGATQTVKSLKSTQARVDAMMVSQARSVQPNEDAAGADAGGDDSQASLESEETPRGEETIVVSETIISAADTTSETEDAGTDQQHSGPSPRPLVEHATPAAPAFASQPIPTFTRRSNTKMSSALPSQNADAGPSRSRSTRITPITVLDEDVELDPVPIATPLAVSRPPRTRPAISVPPNVNKGSRTGHAARRSLKERLAGYSQTPNLIEGDQDTSPEPDEGVDTEAVDDEGSVADEMEEDSAGSVEMESAMDGFVSKNMGSALSPSPEEAIGTREEQGNLVMVNGVHGSAIATPGSPSTISDTKMEIAVDDLDGYDYAPAAKRRLREEAGSDGTTIPTRNALSAASPSASAMIAATPLQAYRSEIASTAPSGEMTLSFSMPRLTARYAKKRRIDRQTQQDNAFASLDRAAIASEAGIGNKDASSAEAALSRVINKDDFQSMKVLGQFNKGFIIARLTKAVAATETDDLFIIDQHACDEKYNFETLQRTTVIKAQALIRPRPLQLTSADELTAIENLDTLKANGFEVAVDEDAAPGRGERVKLVAMPVSKETVFDFKDLEQLLHLLSDSAHSAGQMVRCTKARSMFAMRACRKSVMIGKSLTKGQMTQLLRKMGTIDQPWNCPHGRPTMRHLTKIAGKKSQTGAGRIDWTKWKQRE